MDLDFEISDDVIDGLPVVSVAGEIDVATAPALRSRVEGRISERSPTVVVDLQRVSFLDSTALGVLVGTHQQCQAMGGELRLVASDPRTLRVFEITGLDQIFFISSALETATARSAR